MFENIAVIPMYVGVLKITDSQKDMRWEQQVYIGTDYGNPGDPPEGLEVE